MISILCVCLGNICRSPVAEAVLRNLSEMELFNCRVDSAGTAGYHIGQKPDRRSIEVSRMQGIEIGHLRARQFTLEDFESFDIILVMDQNNFNDVQQLTANVAHREKIFLFREDGQDVKDPYYGGVEDFKEMFDVLLEHGEIWIKKLKAIHQ